jgi:hypothetical protein
MKKFEVLIPDPKNLIHALRDIGYTLETAMADIIDNSIAANSTHIEIFVHFNMEDSYIVIIDNGTGMNKEKLLQAMNLGSVDPLEKRDKKDLGRFGLGLKTASFSQASVLTVASRQDDKLIARSWDLDHVAKTKKWEIGILTATDAKKIPRIEVLPKTGTLVLWKNLNRLIDTGSKRKSEDIFWEKIDDAREHLGLVFHRYLTGEPGLKKLSIRINGDPIIPFDPFEGAGKYFPDESFGNIKFEAYLLPHHSKTSIEEYRRLGGKEGYTKSQGFYVYRNARLMIHGTWFRLAAQTEATKLARVKIDLPNSEDFSWAIDVKKSRAIPPEAIRIELKRTIDKIMSSSSRVYKNRGARISKKDYAPIWTEHHQHNEKSYRLNDKNPSIESFLSSLDDVTRRKAKDIFSMIESTLPIDSIYADLTAEPENVNQNSLTDEQLATYAEEFWLLQSMLGNSSQEISLKLKQTEPFSKFDSFCDSFIESKVRKI